MTAATDRLIATAMTLDGAGLTQPSLCAGWTRAHVLTHVARNADGLTNLLTWARTGVEHHQYDSVQSRADDIEAGAGRTVDEIVDDLQASAGRFAKAVMDMSDDGWERQVRKGAGATGDLVPGRRILWLRLREVEMHHVDLSAGYGPDQWPGAFVQRALDETVRRFSRRDDVPPVILNVDGGGTDHIGPAGASTVTVSGTPTALLSWLTGRTSGHDLRVEPAGSLPPLPAWL